MKNFHRQIWLDQYTSDFRYVFNKVLVLLENRHETDQMKQYYNVKNLEFVTRDIVSKFPTIDKITNIPETAQGKRMRDTNRELFDMLSEIVTTTRYLWEYTDRNIPTHDTEKRGVLVQLYDELYELTMEFKELWEDYLDQLLNVKI